MDLAHGRDMHRGREAVVRGLAEIDVIVRMDWALRAARAAERLVGEVRNHLVHVHVGLRARSGLPDDERKLVVVPAVDHLLRRRRDRVAEPAVERAQRHVGERSGLLLERERADEGKRHALAADAEILERALRLRSPIALGRDRDRAHAVALDSGVCHRLSPRPGRA